MFAKFVCTHIHLHDGKLVFVYLLASETGLSATSVDCTSALWTKASVFCHVNDQTNRNSHSARPKRESDVQFWRWCMCRHRSSFTHTVCTHHPREPMLKLYWSWQTFTTRYDWQRKKLMRTGTFHMKYPVFVANSFFLRQCSKKC